MNYQLLQARLSYFSIASIVHQFIIISSSADENVYLTVSRWRNSTKPRDKPNIFWCIEDGASWVQLMQVRPNTFVFDVF